MVVNSIPILPDLICHLPCGLVRVLTPPIQLRRDLGGVQYTPTILIMFFADDKTFRAKYEGEAEVRQGLGSGRIRGIIKEFLERRVKVKMAERMAEELATHVATTMTEREKKLRQEYEDKMRR